MATKKAIDVAAKAVVWTFDDGSTQTFDLTQVTPELAVMLSLHGASQKIGDSYAGAKESGTDPLAYAKEAVKDTIAQLYKGEWKIARTGTGAPRTSFLIIAFAKITGKSLEESQELVGGLTDEEKAALQKKPKIAAALAALRADAAVAKAAELAKKAEEAEKAEAAAAVTA